MLQNEQPSNKWLVKDNNPKIRKKSVPVTLPLTSEDELTMKKLIDYVVCSQDKKKNKDKHLIPAIGLAACQIGVNKQMYYIRLILTEKDGTKKLIEHALINPKIIGFSKQKSCLSDGEGCLSVNQQKKGYVIRNFKVIVTGYDYLKNKEVKITAINYEAIVIQHEQKHLEGILYYDLINKENPWKEIENCIYL